MQRVKKLWGLLHVGAYLEEWVANNTAWPMGGHCTLAPFRMCLVSLRGCRRWLFEWRDYVLGPPVRINIGPERNKKKARLARPEDVMLPVGVEDGVDLELPEDDGGLPEENFVLPSDVEAGPELGGIAAAPAPPVLCRPVAAVLCRPAAVSALTLNMGLRLGCLKCRGVSGGCVQCRPLAWRQARVAREARLDLARSNS